MTEASHPRQLLLWMDFGTTGLSPYSCHVIQWACEATTSTSSSEVAISWTQPQERLIGIGKGNAIFNYTIVGQMSETDHACWNIDMFPRIYKRFPAS